MEEVKPRAGRHYPRSTGEFQAWFSTDSDCLDYLEWLRWPDGLVCPRCGCAGGWRVADGGYKCASCAARTAVTAGTLFDRRRTPLTVWFTACWMVASQKDGVSAQSLQRALEIGSYQTAWAMLHRLRSVLVRPGRDRLTGIVEVDETYIGGEEPGLAGGRAKGKKSLVGVAIELKEPTGYGRCRMAILDDGSAASLHPFVTDSVALGAKVITDGWQGYRGIDKLGYRRLSQALTDSPNRLAADALLLQRACGLRIGELLDLELDAVHEVPEQGSWLKVPLGKLDTERMVPLDEETVALIDRIVETRSKGRPLPHPRSGRPAQFLFTHHGKRLSQNAVRHELQRAALAAGLDHTTPHQLRHTYATALVNAGVSLQALMALLGHVSATMSLRYGRLFDSTVRSEYERALDLAKTHIGPLTVAPAGRPGLPLVDVTGGADWKDTPALQSRMAGGFCLRAPAQGACPYANICEHCPSFRSDSTHLPVLAAQRQDAQALAADAQARGWIDEADRHHRLIARLDAVMAQAAGT